MTTQTSTLELIKRLSVAVGVTGFAGPQSIHEVVNAEITPLVNRVSHDRLKSITGLKEGEQSPAAGQPRRKVMLAAHLDEIGGMVTRLDKGFLRFTEIGGLDERVLMGQEVTVHGQRDLPGVIGSIPPHFQHHNKSNKVDLIDMLIDVGLPAEEVEQLVQVGDLISFRQTPVELENGLVAGKSLDNRVSVAAMLVCLQELQKIRHQWDVYAVATADEEWSYFLGAVTQAYAIRPDVAIALDVTFADVDEIDVKLDKGPVISLGPSNHPHIRERLVKICEEMEMAYQSEIMPSGAGTDAYAIEVSREGIPTILLSIPSRNMHTAVEIVQPRDVDRVGRLLAQFIAGLDDAFVAELIPKI